MHAREGDFSCNLAVLGARWTGTGPVREKQRLQLLSQVCWRRVVQILQLVWVGSHVEELVVHGTSVVPIPLRGELSV